ncbi:MAG: ABC transporter permease [Nanobdellota archaeon]
MAKRKKNNSCKYKAVFLIVVIAILIYWQYFFDSFLLSTPKQILTSLITLFLNPNVWKNIAATSIRVYVSLIISIILGTLIGSLSYFNKNLTIITKYIFNPTQYIDSAVWTIIAIVCFGLSLITPYFVIVLVIVPNIFVAVEVGINNIKNEIYELGKIYTKKKSKLFKHIIFPQIIPQLLIGTIRSHAVAWKIVVTAEVFISINGLGFMLNNYFKMIDISNLFATIIIIVLMGSFTDTLLKTLIYKTKMKHYVKN